jgi:hypothetical protein
MGAADTRRLDRSLVAAHEWPWEIRHAENAAGLGSVAEGVSAQIAAEHEETDSLRSPEIRK